MKTNYFIIGITSVIMGGLILFSSCKKEEEEIPTKEKMQGVWEVTEAYDDQDSSILNKVSFIMPSFIQLDDNNSVNSTAGPQFMYVVYGKSKFINITSKLDEAFKYADLKMTEGEFFMKNEVDIERFTIEIKMKFPTMETITTIFDLMGLKPPQLFEWVIYHKFYDVKVTVSGENDDVMTWEFDDATYASYNTKDDYGNYVLWHGLDGLPFTKCRFILTKRAKTLIDLIKENS